MLLLLRKNTRNVSVILLLAVFGILAGLVLQSSLFNPGPHGALPVADTTYHKVLPPMRKSKARPVAPLSVQIAITPDTSKRQYAERKPIITAVNSRKLNRRKELVTVDYIDARGIESRVATELRPGSWQVRGDTIAPILQDRRSVRREKWRKLKRGAVVLGVGVITGLLIAK